MQLDTRMWAMRRKLLYLIGIGFLLALLIAVIYYTLIYKTPTCTDGSKNGTELGIDCGGACARACLFNVAPPVVRFTRVFRIAPGLYNAVAYVENHNADVGAPSIGYTFVFYGDQGQILGTLKGHTTLPPNNVYPVFADRILLGDVKPARVALELDQNATWEKMSDTRDQFAVTTKELTGADSAPRLNVTLQNKTLDVMRNVEAVATMFDQKGNPLTASRVTVPQIDRASSKQVVFTWPEPIAKTLRSCQVPSDVVLAIDLSGSITEDGGTPPEPLATVLRAAHGFVNRLREGDRAGLVTFATKSIVREELTDQRDPLTTLIDGLTVGAPSERGTTNTGEGIKSAVLELLSARHNPNARKVLIILTDGKANAPDEKTAEPYALTLADEAKKFGVEIYTVGLGKSVNAAFVKALASGEQNSYLAVDRQTLDGIYKNISSAICEDGAAVIDVIPKIDRSGL